MDTPTRRALATTACAFAVLVAGGCARHERRIDHVFVIVLENKNFATTFGDSSPAAYLADTLARQGAFLRQYHGIGHYSLDNYIAMISGMAPTPETQADCGRFENFVETGTAPDGQPIGHGCVYPAHVQTVANQLSARGLTWHAYMEDMGADPAREAARCGHPVVGEPDRTEGATLADEYATKHDPFVYFHSIIDSAAYCEANVVPLTGLEADLQAKKRTPNFVFISPGLCHDGHDTPCIDGEPGGLVSADRFLQHWVPLITRSPAYREGGLLIITFDEATGADSAACCNERPGPNVTLAGVRGPGGGRTGAVLLSPSIAPGTVSDVPYNHYSLLRSIEDIFGLAHLGYAAQEGLASFGSDVFATRARH
ncbi:MAG: phosphoesterase [Gemmatimonadaceae bacterium]|nr:phosphoesterase [Gemmatimonadaceae bacterium]NUQ93066.1 phosphoesterase [Gemmatimonadaceae bacterium]NUS99121.1 phosphoesterase [Gemmatimonadaceae bacterium]